MDGEDCQVWANEEEDDADDDAGETPTGQVRAERLLVDGDIIK